MLPTSRSSRWRNTSILRRRRRCSVSTLILTLVALIFINLTLCVAQISDSTQHDRRLAAEVGKPTHKRHEFSAEVSDYTWFHNSTNVIAHCLDGTIWLSVNEGYTWTQLKDIGGDFGDGHAMAVIPHKYEPSRAYLIARGQRIWVTMDYGQNWKPFDAPDLPNAMFIDVLGFHHENPDWLIWTGQFHCDSVVSPDCRARAWYSTDNGQYWKPIDEYVRTCTWPAKGHFPGKPSTIMCQSYKSKKGSQPTFNSNNNALELISGDQFYNPSYRRKIFDNVIDSATFSDFLLVGELRNKGTDLQMQVSLNGVDWAVPTFPPNMAPKSPAYTVLESRTKALFLHVTTHSNSGSEWGTLMKSNSNGSYYAISQEHVNRNSKGFVDFDKTQSLEGIAFLNVVTNPDSAALNKVKTLQTRVSHNDGGHWDLLDPPGLDSLGKSYDCVQKNCSLHLQSFTERPNPALSYTSPSAPGLILAVGNVGSKLGKWSDGDTFLSRDGGFVWEEVRKGAYMWEFGDQGNIIVMAADQKPTSKVIYTLDQGKAWSEYDFGEELIVTGIATVPEDVHRKFMLFGLTPKAAHKTIGIFLDFTHTEPRKCNRDPAHPENDDFELFSPSENRKEDCLFGTQTYYIRRKRQAKCYVGEELKNPHEIRKTCECTDVDFECEYNFARNSTGQCVQLPGTSLLPEDPYSQCSVKDSKGNLADQWFERTSVRKIPISKCEGGKRPDRGKAHDCPNRLRWAHGIFWWGSVLFAAVLLAGLVSFWWTQKAGNRGSGGRIRLPGSSSTPSGFSSGGPLSTLASVVPFLQGVGLIVFSKLYDLAESIPGLGRSRTRESFGYRSLSADADAEVLNDYDDDEEA